MIKLDYINFHRKRWMYLLDLLDEYLEPHFSILDIGRSPLTALIYQRGYKNLTTLGFPISKTHLDKLVKIPNSVPHIEFDLINCKYPEKWVKLPEFDAIIFAEVLEHLCVAPEYVFSYFRSLLRIGGYLFIQTPNAVSIGKRLKMIMGLHPYETKERVMILDISENTLKKSFLIMQIEQALRF